MMPGLLDPTQYGPGNEEVADNDPPDYGNMVYDKLAGLGDHLAGNVDESIARQFDDEPGGGFADADTWAGWADHAAGSIDESIGRQFDDTPGGGFADRDTWVSAADDLAGSTDEWVYRTIHGGPRQDTGGGGGGGGGGNGPLSAGFIGIAIAALAVVYALAKR